MALSWERPKDPTEVIDYEHDWSADLGTDTIASSAWSLVNAAGVSINSDSKTSTVSRVFLSGGTAGETALLLNRIVTAGGREMEQAFQLAIVDATYIAATPTEAETLAGRLAEAKAALHQIAVGNKVVEVWRDGRRLTYSRSNMADLQKYVLWLENEIAKEAAVAAGQPRRSAIRFDYGC